MKQKKCLADNGKHRWKYLTPARRECQKCGALQEKQGQRWVQAGSTRWVPLTPAERARETDSQSS